MRLRGKNSLDLLRVRSNCRRGEYVLQRGWGRSFRHHRSLRDDAARLAEKEAGMAEMTAKFRESGGEVYVAGSGRNLPFLRAPIQGIFRCDRGNRTGDLDCHLNAQ